MSSWLSAGKYFDLKILVSRVFSVRTDHSTVTRNAATMIPIISNTCLPLIYNYWVVTIVLLVVYKPCFLALSE